jgi:membrane associated rhomboid family serine protease
MYGQPRTQSRVRDSISVQITLILVIVYVAFGFLGGDISTLNLGMFSGLVGNCRTWQGVASYFVQNNCLVWQGWVWMLFTSLFMHASILHLGGNILFLLIFGTSLEEQVSRRRWLTIFLASGLTGSLAFLLLGPILGQELGLGASGAVYGLLGAAGGLKGAVIMIFLLGLNLFAGGGEIAHVAGLLTGLVFHRWGDQLASLFRLRVQPAA